MQALDVVSQRLSHLHLQVVVILSTPDAYKSFQRGNYKPSGMSYENHVSH
jgi:hypothetical protein